MLMCVKSGKSKLSLELYAALTYMIRDFASLPFWCMLTPDFRKSSASPWVIKINVVQTISRRWKSRAEAVLGCAVYSWIAIPDICYTGQQQPEVCCMLEHTFADQLTETAEVLAP